MKSESLRSRAHASLLAVATCLAVNFAQSASLPLVGLEANLEGSVAWNANGSGPEPAGNGHPLPWLPISTTAYYYTASAEYDGIVAGSPGGSHFMGPANGFPNLTAALAANSLGLTNIFTRFGPMNLGADVQGADWDYNPGTTTEWRLYRGGDYRLVLHAPGVGINHEPLVRGPVGDLMMTLHYNVINDPNDDQIDGVTSPFMVADDSASASAVTKAIAQAFLLDVNGQHMRTSFTGLQPTTSSAFSGNGRAGGRFEAQSGILESITPQALNIDDAVAHEGAGTITFDVSLNAPEANTVTVDFDFVDGSATNGVDYTGHNGTLTFLAGETQKSITFGVIEDVEVEIHEQFEVRLSNANGAPINKGTGVGVILDNDLPDFPPIDPEFYPTNTPCICTPLAGIYRTNASEIWHVKLLGAAGLLRVAAVAVSTNDSSTVEALVYNSAGMLVGSNQVSYTVPELVASGDMHYTKWVDIGITNQTPGDTLRVEVHNLPPTPQTQTHYRLHGEGVRWMSTPSPSFAGFESDPTRWRFLVRSNEDLVINYFTNNLPGVAPVDYHLIDPLGNLVQSGTNVPIVLGDEIVVNNAMPGLWTLAMRAMDHYRIAKSSGLDRNIYADWRTGSYADLAVKVRLDGTNAVGTPYDVVLERLNTFGGVTNFMPYEMRMTSSSWAFFTNVQQGLYRISVTPQVGGISTPAPQFEIAACDHPLTNNFDTVSEGGMPAGPPPIISLLPGVAVEADSGQTNHLSFDVALSQPSGVPVTALFATFNGSAQAGSDYVATTHPITIQPGMVLTNVMVPVIGDDVVEQLHERFNATLTGVTNAVLGVDFANGVIVDNDGANADGQVAFVVADGAVYEGDAGPTQLNLPVLLTRPSAMEVRVDFATRNNSATEPSDYQATSGTLVFPAGTVMQMVSVPVNGDPDIEPDEFFWLDLSNPVNAVIDPDADLIGAGNILNDDQGQGGGSGLFAHDAMVREGDGTNTSLEFRVALFPASPDTVTVEYATEDWTASAGADYLPASGTLTFASGETNKSVSVTVLPDMDFEPTELLNFNLSGAVNATIGIARGVGAIKDNDHPDFPPDDNLPDPLPSICTPVVGNYNSNAIHGWSMKAHGGVLNLWFILHSVNTNEAAVQAIRVYDGGGALIVTTNITMDLAEVAMPEYSESEMLALGVRPAGEVLRIEVELLAGPLNAHYSLKANGARWFGTASPSFSAFEEEPTRYRFVVQPTEDLDIDITTNAVNVDVATQLPLRLFDPMGNQVPLAGYPTMVVAGNEIHVPAATPGVWTLEANLTNRIMGHYRIAKMSGVNRGIFFNWASGGSGVIHNKISVNGAAPMPGTVFNVTAWRQRIEAGVPVLEPLTMGVISNNYMFDLDPYEMLPGMYVTQVQPMDPMLGMAQWATNFITCMERATNCFDFMGDGGTNQPPTGPALYAHNNMIREGNITNSVMAMRVELWPPSTNVVTVDYALAPGTATVAVDYQDATGMLTFSPGTTNQWVMVTILPDAVFEGPEIFHLNLANATGAAIAQPQAEGLIKDDDHPDFPGDNDDPLPFPEVAPCVCTPLVGQYETNLPQAWVVRSLGGPMMMRLYGVAVNTNDGSAIEATVYDSTGAVIATPTVSYTAAEVAAFGEGFEKWVDVPLGTYAAGDRLRVEVSLGAGASPTQSHYRLRFCGARWLAIGSPSFAGFEDDAALWRLWVDPSDTHLNIDFFTTNTPVAATAMNYQLYRPDGTLASASGALPIVPGDELSISNPMPGLWALRCETMQDHYRIAKSGGVNNTLYLGWRGASWGRLAGQIKLDGTNAVGMTYDVEARYQFVIGGMVTNFVVDMQTTTNGMFELTDMQHGLYTIAVHPQDPGITTPPPQTNIVACDDQVALVFQTFSVGGGSPVIFVPDVVFHEADTNVMAHFDVHLSTVSATPVTVDFATGGGTAVPGSDYLSASGMVTIPAGMTNAQVAIEVIGNDVFELPKTLRLNLSNPSGATLAVTHATATIADDDRPRAPHFNRVLRLQNGGPFRLEFDLGDAGAVYRIEVSDNLIHWIPIGEVTGAAGLFEFTDNDSTNRVRRFYRATFP